ncbi:MAG: putative regulatory protein [Prokaryotic dsDNA virus sp.]|jgi:DNA-binding transcriptional regulator YdaS (Cro superfamily)|nr:MAG: putative regulatory protein [Prokaryotic dsDNA virus sp.]|tara:strand:+ start:3408 stop:3653 length:246 start_codon:yes stop_codon:yes gene_type:complete
MLLSKSQIKEKQAAELARLIDYVGSRNALASQLGVDYSVVTMWIKRGRISATQATAVERLSEGRFKRQDLRPDVPAWREEV